MTFFSIHMAINKGFVDILLKLNDLLLPLLLPSVETIQCQLDPSAGGFQGFQEAVCSRVVHEIVDYRPS